MKSNISAYNSMRERPTYSNARHAIAHLLIVIGMTAMTFATQPAQADPSDPRQASRWGEDYLPNLPVTDQDGHTYRFFDDLIKDKIVVINFIFTSCTDICPLTTARLAIVQEKLGDLTAQNIHMYSITIDPEHDGPKELKRHADAFGVKPGWLFLTGKPEDIAIIRYKLGERSRVKAEHRHEMMIGNATTGEWGRDSAFGDLDQLARNIHSIDPKWRDTPHAIAHESRAAVAIEVSERPGQALFIKACSACHTVGKGDRVGPDLNNVSSRRGRDWLTNFIRRPDRMFAQKDPAAMALAEKFPGALMPNLQITDADASDLIAYLDAESYGVNADQTAAADHLKQHDHEGHDHQGHEHAEHQHDHN